MAGIEAEVAALRDSIDQLTALVRSQQLRLDRVDPDGRLPGDIMSDFHQRIAEDWREHPENGVAVRQGRVDLPDPDRSPATAQSWAETPGGMAAALQANGVGGAKFAAEMQHLADAKRDGVIVVSDAPGMTAEEKTEAVNRLTGSWIPKPGE